MGWVEKPPIRPSESWEAMHFAETSACTADILLHRSLGLGKSPETGWTLIPNVVVSHDFLLKPWDYTKENDCWNMITRIYLKSCGKKNFGLPMSGDVHKTGGHLLNDISCLSYLSCCSLLISRIPMNTTVDQDPFWLIATQQLGAQLAGLPCSWRMLRKGLSVQRVPSWFCGQWSPTMPTWGHEVPRCHPVFVEPLWIFVDGGYQHAKSLMWVDVGWWLLPSGKLRYVTYNYGKSPFSMGKSSINGHFQ